MEERRAARRFLGLAFASGVLALAVAFPQARPAAGLLILPWALAVGGPAAAWLLHGPAAASERAWLRLAAPVLVGAAGALALVESSLLRHRPRDLVDWAIPLVLPLAFVAAAAPAWRRSDAAGRAWMAGAFAAFALLFLRGADAAIVAFFALEAALVLGLAGFRRSVRAWGASALAGLLVLLGGMAFVLALRGTLYPPRVVLDADEFAALVLPVLLAAAAAACGTLVLWRERGARRRAAEARLN
ncbi:MAG TPA: hypothetical protein VNX21_07630 [Candidatus Thermoplasmatota archaeon]|nr:hypothetical protein [Candidatus Thermoplasmatota archaeon]